MEREKRRERELNENQLEGQKCRAGGAEPRQRYRKDYGQEGQPGGTIKRIVAQAAEKGVVIQEVSRQKLDELSRQRTIRA